VFDVSTQKTTELVEADRVAPPATLIATVVATDQVFTWALQCFGIGETSCNAELRRLSLVTGARDVVARAGAALPFAVSPDGTKIALADVKNQYIQDHPALVNPEGTQSRLNGGCYAPRARAVGMAVNGESLRHVEINEDVGEAGVDEERAYDSGL
jgi:hypothetical protein